MTDEMNHLDEDGHVHMVDVGEKTPTHRRAVAAATVSMAASTADRLFRGDLPKGDAIATVRIAAIMGAKRTSSLVPLCHPLSMESVTVDVVPSDDGAIITVAATVTAKTGVEMEAMTGAAIGAVTLYDMIKGIDRGAEIVGVRLLEKSGGRSGEWRRA
ncbi:MAG TPA: cyclic pyranopterin monophosphate synthase MoaC [Acidimicrobiia bacterium]|nr:cyclic pyranopterin monophosphate synthase MoaC [Acidimicrobiia bacterium]